MEHPTALPTPTLTDIQFKFAAWRKTKKHRSRIPEELWTAAVKLSRNHSICSISRALSLSYTNLKTRVKDSQEIQDKCKTTPSLEFIPIDIVSSLTDSVECIVEMEHRNGNKMRMHFKGKADLDLQSFAESFWGGRG